MAKKKPAAKMSVKKAAPKKGPVKKLTAKATPKKDNKMSKKAPAKKVTAKKAVAKKPAAPKKKVAARSVAKKAQTKSLKDQLIKTAGKLLSKATAAKAPSKEQMKAKAGKEQKEKKALALKAKAQAEADKKKQKELGKNKKEEEKLRLKKEKEELKLAKKAEKEKLKAKGKKGKDEDEEEMFGEESAPRRQVDDEDEFADLEAEYKKSKASKKSGKKAYEVDAEVDLFVGKQSKKYNNAMLADIEGKIADEIAELREHFNWKDIANAIGTLDFFIDPKNDECIEKGCDNIRTTQSYCRLHYLRNWKTIQKKREILQEGKLQEYLEELISKYPPKYIEALLSDLSDDKEFYRVLNELNITSEFDFEEDEFENAVDDDDADDDLGIETISSSLRYEDE